VSAIPAELLEWLRYLADIGVRDWPPANRAVAPAQPPPTAPAGELDFVATASFRALPAAARLARIREVLGECTRCKLHRGRRKIVFGVGNPEARLMFVGEGPGAEEDARGEPFVGRAGQKLDEMIRSIGLARADVYIANVVKSRPPDNRDPEPDEIAACVPFLHAQIEAIRPAVLITLGLPAARTLLQIRTGIGAARGKWHAFRGIPVMPTFHPAYLLRAYTPENRRKVWEDLKAARARMDEALP
jgi:uracil-DNA glycosylase family 4